MTQKYPDILTFRNFGVRAIDSHFPLNNFQQISLGHLIHVVSTQTQPES